MPNVLQKTLARSIWVNSLQGSLVVTISNYSTGWGVGLNSAANTSRGHVVTSEVHFSSKCCLIILILS